MVAIAIDTATERATLIVFDKTKIIVLRELTFGFMHARSLVEALESLGIDSDDLEYVAVGLGPGSYTGIRVGVSCAKAIAYAKKIPLVGISSLANFCPAKEVEGSFISAIDAKTGGVYMMRGTIYNSTICFTGIEEVVPFSQFAEALASSDYLVTPSFHPLQMRLQELEMQQNILPQVIERYPSPSMIIEQAEKAIALGKCVTDGTLLINYLKAGSWG